MALWILISWAGISFVSADTGVSRSDSLLVEDLTHRARQFREKGQFPAALATLDSALSRVEELKYNEGLLRVLIETAVTRHILNDYDIALELLFRAERISEQQEDRRASAEINNNIGAIYHTQGEFTKAADYYNRSLDINLELESIEDIGRAYNNFGVLWQDREEPLTAIEYHRKSIAIWRSMKNEGWLGVSDMHMGVCYKMLGNLDSAVFYLDQSAETIENLEESRILSLIYAELGIVYKEKGDFEAAVKWCKQGLDISSEMGIVDFQRKNCECLFEAHEKMGNEGDALGYHKLYTAFQDLLHNEQKAKEMTRIEMDHAFAQQQFTDSVRRSQQQVLVELKHQEELANERADRNIAMAIGIGIFLLAGALWSRLLYVRKAQRAIQKERDRSDELLLNILPAEIAAELKRDGKAKAKRYDSVTILFTDFAKFTETAAKMPASELVEEINQCFTEFDRICEKHGIEKIKTIGDSFMAAGGIPLPDPDAVSKVIIAATEMQEFMVKRAQQRKAENLPAFRMRAGIHTGPVVAGIVGVKKFQYDIWGDAVNIASRLESKGQVDRVNISAETYKLVRENTAFSFTSRGKIEVKGKGEVEMYFVDGSNV